MIGAFSFARKREGDSRGCANTLRRRQIAECTCKPAKALTARASGAEPSRNQKALQNVERLQMWKVQETSRPYRRDDGAPDQMFPMRDVESCEGHEPRAIAFERNECGILRDKSFDSKVKK